ncbi:MAG: beta-lactamase family protein [Deltaproteobacteria bacterium]|nr:beta-lactamase family protein [Deltaproteobacteria bacterium]
MLGPVTALVLAAAPADFDARVMRFVHEDKLPPGIALYVADGKIAAVKAWGARADDEKLTPEADALFRIGSNTKTFTALAILALRDAGKLSLDDPLTKWIPEAKPRPAHEGDRAPNVRDLLQHRSGLPRAGSLLWRQITNKSISDEDVVSALSVKLEDAPGAMKTYSNLGYAALGMIVARASGMPYAEYVKQHVLAPLGITDAVWRAEDVPPAKRIHGHESRFFGGWKVDDDEWHLGTMDAAGGLYASANDMAQLALFELGQRDGPVKPETVRESQQAADPTLGKSGGMGWDLVVAGKSHIIYKNGGMNAWNSGLVIHPEKRVALVLLLAGKSEHVDEAALGILKDLVTSPGAPDAGAK